jgi:thiol peroxidase
VVIFEVNSEFNFKNKKMAKVTLKGNPVNTIGNLPQVGSKAPDFKLVKTDLSEVSISDYKGKKVVLNIFPSVDTGTCATSVRQFNAKAASVDNTVILCVSADLPFAHARFCGAEGITNLESLSSFRDSGDFGNNYGVTFTDGPLKGLTARAVVVIDENGMVKYTELVPEIVDEPNYESALKSL